MPKSSADTTSAIAALPSVTVNPTVVHVALVFEGVAFSPAALRAALDAAYGTVTSDVDGAERPQGPFRFRITA
jgi:hypothetical protein